MQDITVTVFYYKNSCKKNINQQLLYVITVAQNHLKVKKEILLRKYYCCCVSGHQCMRFF